MQFIPTKSRNLPTLESFNMTDLIKHATYDIMIRTSKAFSISLLHKLRGKYFVVKFFLPVVKQFFQVVFQTNLPLLIKC